MKTPTAVGHNAVRAGGREGAPERQSTRDILTKHRTTGWLTSHTEHFLKQ